MELMLSDLQRAAAMNAELLKLLLLSNIYRGEQFER